MQLTTQDVDAVCDLVHELSGIYLDDRKSYLIETRLGEILARTGCENYVALANQVRRSPELGLRQEIIDAITTQETLFFRDGSPFAALKHKALPELFDARETPGRTGRLRIWSAASSTGQEAYSIAITLCELLPDLDSWDIQILATDISDAAIAKASRGRFYQHEVDRGMPIELLHRYFRHVGDQWQVDERVRSLISFRQRNLHEDFFGVGQFDVIFCRNVAIYFTPEARKSLFERLTKQLAPDGYMFVGASELLSDLGARFTPQCHCRSVYYRPNFAPTMA